MMFEIYSIAGRVEQIPEETAVTVGVFDGVHLGHQALLTQLKAESEKRKAESLVVTLTAHPSFVLGRRDSEYWLDDPEEHLRLLFEAGAKYVAVLPFTQEVAQLSACAMARLLHNQLNMRCLLLGYDSRFGCRTQPKGVNDTSKVAHDDFDSLPQLAAGLGFTLLRGTPFTVDDAPISSSRIRQTLLEGRVEDTAALLGRHYTLGGTVQHGRGVGHTLGFPTANIDLAGTRKMMPTHGVYAVRVTCSDTKAESAGIANLGAAPTFGIDKPLLEVHLIDFDGDLYGRHTTVAFTHRLRDIRRFDSSEELQRQIQQDRRRVLSYEF